MTVTRCPQASQRATWPYRFVPVPPPCGWVQSRSVSSSTWRAITRDRSDGEGASGARLESALVPVRSRVGALLAVLAVAFAPGAALAQSGGAGDDQYVDPIGGNTQQQNGGNSSSGSGSNGTSTGPALSATPSLSASSGQPAPAAPASSSGATLPRTGLDVGFVAAIGLALVLTGAAVRVRLRHERL